MSTAAGLVLDVAAREVGQHEEGANNHGPAVRRYLGAVGLGEGNPWCFAGETEILTEDGWRRFDDLLSNGRGRKVAMVDPQTREVSLGFPIAYIHKKHDGPVVDIDRPGMRLTCDPAHRFFGDWKVTTRKGFLKSPEPEIKPIYYIADGVASEVTIPNISAGHDEAPVSDEDLRILGLLFSDGYFHRGCVEASVSRERKVALLESWSPSHIYRAKKAYGPRSTKPLTHFLFRIPRCAQEAICEDTKALKAPFLMSLSRRQAAILLDTITTLDGHQRKNHMHISQSSKERIDSLQTLALLAGQGVRTVRPRVTGEFGSTMYGMGYCQKAFRIRQKDVKLRNAKVDLYCVQVPTGLIVVRPTYGRAIVVGNCAAFVAWCFQRAEVQGWPATGDTWAIRDWSRERGVLRTVPAPGDVFLLIGSDGQPYHTGLVERVRGGVVDTVEGNTGGASDADGDGVYRKSRPVEACRFVHWQELLAPASTPKRIKLFWHDGRGAFVDADGKTHKLRGVKVNGKPWAGGEIIAGLE